jgi:hypothetical protein
VVVVVVVRLRVRVREERAVVGADHASSEPSERDPDLLPTAHAQDHD